MKCQAPATEIKTKFSFLSYVSRKGINKQEQGHFCRQMHTRCCTVEHVLALEYLYSCQDLCQCLSIKTGPCIWISLKLHIQDKTLVKQETATIVTRNGKCPVSTKAVLQQM